MVVENESTRYRFERGNDVFYINRHEIPVEAMDVIFKALKKDAWSITAEVTKHTFEEHKPV